MTAKININADMGEGFGAYEMGNDDDLLGIVRSANVACGFHAGDPLTMHRTVSRAAEQGVSIGAHPGFDDLWGFGRRRIEMRPGDLELMVAYQIGALQALAAHAGTRVTHVKAHGALSNMAATDEDYALAIGRAIKGVDRDLIYLAIAGTAMERAGDRLGLPVAREGFCDRTYEEDGNLTSRKIPGSVLSDPGAVRDHVMRMVLDREIVTRTGKRIRVEVESLCVHGDEPTALTTARAAREALEAQGVAVVPLTEVPLSRGLNGPS